MRFAHLYYYFNTLFLKAKPHCQIRLNFLMRFQISQFTISPVTNANTMIYAR